MSSHCFHVNWSIHTDEVTPQLLEDIASCVIMNMNLATKSLIGCFVIGNDADQINHWCWENWVCEKDYNKRVEMIEEESKLAPDPEKFKQICMHVLEQVEKEPSLNVPDLLV